MILSASCRDLSKLLRPQDLPADEIKYTDTEKNLGGHLQEWSLG